MSENLLERGVDKTAQPERARGDREDSASLRKSSAQCVSVIIPVYNEGATLVEVLRKVCCQSCVGQIVVIDDASDDATSELLWSYAQKHPQPPIIIKRHETNRGKGAALRTGIAFAISPIVLIQDADLEYDPDDYENLIRPILIGKADVVYGSRFLGAGTHRVLYFWHAMGNRFLTLASNVMTNLTLSDVEVCYKVFRREVIQNIEISEERFGFEPEITAKVSRLPVRIYEVPVSYYGRTYAEGKKVGWRDGFRALWCIVKYNLLWCGGKDRRTSNSKP